MASVQTVQIAAPFLQPQLTVGIVKPDHLNPGTTAVLSVTVANAGNIDAVGLLQITVNPSIDGGTPFGGIALAGLSRRVRIRTGKSATFRLRIKTPAALIPGRYFPLVSVSLAGVDITGVNANEFAVI